MTEPTPQAPRPMRISEREFQRLIHECPEGNSVHANFGPDGASLPIVLNTKWARDAVLKWREDRRFGIPDAYLLVSMRHVLTNEPDILEAIELTARNLLAACPIDELQARVAAAEVKS